MNKRRGFTLVELIVSVGLFAVVMVLAAGSYFIMISMIRQTQGMATGINNLAHTLESMTRNIRVGYDYSCGGAGGDCAAPGASSFSFTNESNETVTYSLGSGRIRQTIDTGQPADLTDPAIVVSSLKFIVTGTPSLASGNTQQARVTILISGSVATGPGQTMPFSVETGASMRGSDL
jgi:prepilin-type N-terminal cleavage/methylation domain-containing protein